MSSKWIAAAAIAALVSCGGKRDLEQRYAKAVAEQRARSGAPANELVSIGQSGDDVDIVYFENGVRHDLQGRKTGSFNYRKYSTDGGKGTLEVAERDYGFKERDVGGSPIHWTVRLYPDGKIKFEENDSGKNPFRIRIESPNEAKVTDASENEIGKVTWDGRTTLVTDAAGKLRFSKATPKLEQAYGVMLIDPMAQIDRYIVAAELMSRGR